MNQSSCHLKIWVHLFNLLYFSPVSVDFCDPFGSSFWGFGDCFELIFWCYDPLGTHLATCSTSFSTRIKKTTLFEIGENPIFESLFLDLVPKFWSFGVETLQISSLPLEKVCAKFQLNWTLFDWVLHFSSLARAVENRRTGLAMLQNQHSRISQMVYLAVLQNQLGPDFIERAGFVSFLARIAFVLFLCHLWTSLGHLVICWLVWSRVGVRKRSGWFWNIG